MFAVVETGGKQYQVQEGKYIDIDLLDVKPEENVTLEKVVAIIAGEKSQIGQPYLENAKVEGKILKHDKKKKILIYKMKRKKGYRVKQGHRQGYTRLLVENITFDNKEAVMSYAKTIEQEAEKKQKEAEDKILKSKEKKFAKKPKTEVKAEEAVEVKAEETAEVKAEETAEVKAEETAEVKAEETTEVKTEAKEQE